MASTRRPSSAPRSRLRLIGGALRGRLIEFTEEPGLRPTPDRVRETLFNWLQPLIAGSHCLDLFAGSGALGFEALSRGASSVTLVEHSVTVGAVLRANASRLGATEIEITTSEAIAWLRRGVKRRYDIVFLDPPFHSGLLEQALDVLGNGEILSPGALVYLESDSNEAPPQTPEGWSVYRDKRAGQVAYRLLRARAC